MGARSRPGTLCAVLAVAVLLLAGLRAAPAGASGAVTYFPLAGCCPMQELGVPGAVIVLESDGQHGDVLRLDPASGTVTAQLHLPATPAGDAEFSVPKMVVAAGSVWFSSYFENLVYRLDPVTLAVQARIRTGRSPSSLTVGGGMLWTSLNNDRAVERIDPTRNAVTKRIPVGRQDVLTDEPYTVAWTGSQVLVALPSTGRVAHVSSDGRTVTYDRVGDAVGDTLAGIDPVPGGYWLDDTNGDTVYHRWTYAAHALTAAFRTPGGTGAVAANHALYTGGGRCDDDGCTQGLIEKHDPTTGRLLARRDVGPREAFLPFLVLGQLWTTDFDGLTLQRSALF